ncbi:MAG: chemotaxis response regulator protein-glutamate methylesterase [Pseudomonadota bacterium]
MTDKIRVLVADDSALMRVRISEMLNADPEIEVIATARDGMDALEKIMKIRPDVVTLDVEMPRLDGLNTLGYIMSEIPTPVVMVSAYTQRGAEAAFRSLEYGAVDFVPKPSGTISRDIGRIREDLIAKVKIAAKVDLGKLEFISPRGIEKKRWAGKPGSMVSGKKIVAIGASTGGPRALANLLPKLPPDIAAGVLVVQHMPAGFTRSLADRLDSECLIAVKEAREGDIIEAGQALIAPGDYHMTVEKGGVDKREAETVSLNHGPPLHGVRPSVDIMMQSAARVYGSNVVGVILTGMGSDGVEGMKRIKKFDGRTLAEHESTCVVYGMPKSAIQEGVVDKVVPLSKMADAIMDMLER